MRILPGGRRGVHPETLPRGCLFPVRESQQSEVEKQKPERATETEKDKEKAHRERRGDREGTVGFLLTLLVLSVELK